MAPQPANYQHRLLSSDDFDNKESSLNFSEIQSRIAPTSHDLRRKSHYFGAPLSAADLFDHDGLV